MKSYEFTEEEIAYIRDIIDLDYGAQLSDWDDKTSRDVSKDSQLAESILAKTGGEVIRNECTDEDLELLMSGMFK